MYDMKQSTAETIVFFVHDVNGDAVTGLVDAGFTKRISKGSGAFAAMTVVITEMENGFYSAPLSTVHSDTVGILTILFTHASSKQVNLQWRVQARLADDLAFPSVSGRNFVVEADGQIHADLKEWLGVAPLALVTQRVAANAQVVGDKTGYALTVADKDDIVNRTWNELIAEARTALSIGQRIKDAVGLDTLTAARVGNLDNLDAAVTSRAVAGDAMALTAAAVDVIWDEAQAGHVAAGTFGRFLDSQLATIQADTDDIQTRLTLIQADTDDIQTRIPVTLVGGRMDASVGAMAADVLTATAIATDAIGADEFAQAAADKVFGASGAVLPELGVAIPAATPTPREAMMLLYMALRNKLDVDASFKEVHNDAGSVIAKKALTDTAGVYSEAEMAAGP